MNVPSPRPLLVVGAGIAGITAAVEAAEGGKEAGLVEREQAGGGRGPRRPPYFPQPPPAGPRGRAVAKGARGAKGGTATSAVSPHFVNGRGTVCGECAKVRRNRD